MKARESQNLNEQGFKLLDELASLPSRPDLQKTEPSELAAIRAARSHPPNLPKLRLSETDLLNRIAGGWLGRAAGGLLGKPVEKIPRAGIRELLESNGTWPLTGYITAHGIPEALQQKYPWNRHFGKESLRENIRSMPEDDDLNYTMLNLHIVETFGVSVTTEGIAETWLSMLPVLSTFTAERVAYLNCLRGYTPPWTATFRNPYREWIGAQIRADIWGWVSPGNPELAAELAWRDARLSHVRNGVYGEMFFAAAVAAAFVCDDPAIILEHGLSQIPASSRLAKAIRFAMTLPKLESTWEGAVDQLYERFGSYYWVHSVNNAALAAAALHYGEGDFERSVCNVVMGGWDTDSNGATVGSIVGTMLGASKLPGKWIAPLNNRIRSSMKGFDNSAIDDLALRTAKQVARHSCRDFFRG
jgi:ADP-ribosylglycohydrolase